MDEISLTGWAIQHFTGIPASVVGLTFAGGSYLRNKYKTYAEKKNERWIRDMDAEVKRQLDHIYSVTYKAMESRIYNKAKNRETFVLVRNEKDEEQTPLGAYRTGYKDAVKEVAFKKVLPCIMDKVVDDYKRYNRDDNVKYIVDTGEDILHSFTSSLGRKVGICEISLEIEEEILTQKLFVDMYSKIIRRARGK